MRLRIGPGAVVTAAFIGPGTVTTCTLAGVRFGYALLWALVFATLGTIILQEMAARLGTVARMGLGEALRTRARGAAGRWGAAALVSGAIVVGNAAYQAGNLSGTALGMDVIIPAGIPIWVLLYATIAAGLLWTGRYRLIERVLIAMVVIMSVVFLATAIAVAPNAAALARGAVMPAVPDGAGVIALGLVGTTIVPYNLFLHARAASERFTGETALTDARADLIVAIGLGGIVSMAIVITAAAAPGIMNPSSVPQLARQLEPLLGRWATDFFAIGLFAAGLTSTITAPLAAAIALSGAMGWTADMRSRRFRATWLAVIMVGAFFAAHGQRPVALIVFAQAANGLLLPIVAVFLLLVMNDRRLLGDRVNGTFANVMGVSVVLLAALLGVRGLIAALR